EHEELAARIQVQLAALCQPLDERNHDCRDVDLRRLELLFEYERQEQVERALERVEVELELAHDHARETRARSGRDPSGSPSPAPAAPAWPAEARRRHAG